MDEIYKAKNGVVDENLVNMAIILDQTLFHLVVIYVF